MVTAAAAIAPRRRMLDWRAVPLGVALPLLYVLLMLVLTAFGQWLMPYSPAAQDLYLISAPPSAEHWLGTDDLGRDVLSRLIAGARTAIMGPLVVAVVGFIGSSLIGIYAGYSGGGIDNAIMRVVDFVIAMPSLLIAIVLVSVLPLAWEWWAARRRSLTR